MRCAQCRSVFNALSHFIIDPIQSEQHPRQAKHDIDGIAAQTLPDTTQPSPYYQYVTEYMHSHVDGSKLDLYTYLNNLNRINPRPNTTLESEHALAAFTTLYPEHSAKGLKSRYNRRLILKTAVLIMIVVILLSYMLICA